MDHKPGEEAIKIISDAACHKIDLVEQILPAIKNKMRESVLFLSICSIVIIAVAFIMIYCAIQIYNILTFYMARKKQQKESEMKAGGRNSLTNPKNDNEIYKPKLTKGAEEDEYKRIYGTIQTSFGEHKAYNTKLEDYYKNVRNESAPDRIDRSVLLQSNDNW